VADSTETPEVTVASITAQLSAQEKAIQAASAAGDFDEVNRIVLDRAPLLAKRSRLVKDENKGAIEQGIEALKGAVGTIVSGSKLPDLTGEAITKIAFYIEDGQTYIYVNQKSLKRPGTRAPRAASSGLSNDDKVFRMVDGKREDSTVGAVVESYASDEVKAGSPFQKKAFATLFPKVSEDMDDDAFTVDPGTPAAPAAPATAPAA